MSPSETRRLELYDTLIDKLGDEAPACSDRDAHLIKLPSKRLTS